MTKYIRWTHEEGSEVGLVVSEGTDVVFTNAQGQFSVPANDGKFEEITEKTFLHHNHGEAVVRDIPTPSQTPKTKTVKTGSKKEQAIALYKANSGKTRKELIALFVQELGMTPAGASTYVNMAKNG